MTMQTFWYIRYDHTFLLDLIAQLRDVLRFSSQLLFYVCQKLLHHQLPNYPEVLRWLRQLLISRNAYLYMNRDIASFGSQEQM